jgi:tetrapyrrole methylase family protein/MazG family protein
MSKEYTFEDLLDIVRKLRGEGGCPWDMEQTHESIKHNIIEEGYELVEALEECDFPKMADESGDLLLQVVFHAQIGAENSEYNIDDVISAVCKKLIHGHPHVFGDVSVKDSEEVLSNWNKIKRDDRGQKTIAQDMQGVSKFLPSLMRAQKIQGKAEKSGYIFNEPPVAVESIANITGILSSNEDKEIAEKYVGKMLFELVSVAKAHGVDAETALSRHINSFISEFEKYES